MKLDQSEVGTKTERDVAEKLATGQARMICGAVVEHDEPTGNLNLRVNLDAIHALAVQTARKRQGR